MSNSNLLPEQQEKKKLITRVKEATKEFLTNAKAFFKNAGTEIKNFFTFRAVTQLAVTFL